MKEYFNYRKKKDQQKEKKKLEMEILKHKEMMKNDWKIQKFRKNNR